MSAPVITSAPTPEVMVQSAVGPDVPRSEWESPIRAYTYTIGAGATRVQLPRGKVFIFYCSVDMNCRLFETATILMPFYGQVKETFRDPNFSGQTLWFDGAGTLTLWVMDLLS